MIYIRKIGEKFRFLGLVSTYLRVLLECKAFLLRKCFLQNITFHHSQPWLFLSDLLSADFSGFCTVRGLHCPRQRERVKESKKASEKVFSTTYVAMSADILPMSQQLTPSKHVAKVVFCEAFQSTRRKYRGTGMFKTVSIPLAHLIFFSGVSKRATVAQAKILIVHHHRHTCRRYTLPNFYYHHCQRNLQSI
jgi:hypothetical protein